MSMDMSQFYQVFFEESAELLAEMENLLLKIDMESPDIEELNAIFRVAHSIKGGASTFGFTDMTDVTHVLESLLDRVRKGQLALSADMVDTFLKAGDVLKGQLAGHRGDGAADAAAVEFVCAALKRLAGGNAAATPSPAAAPVVAPVAVTVQSTTSPAPVREAAESAPALDCYAIEFTLSATATAATVVNLRTNLGALGGLEALSGPPAGALAGVYRWRLAGSASEEDVWEVLAFVADPALIKIEREAVAAQSAVVIGDAVPASTDHGFFEPLYEALVPQTVSETKAPPPAAIALVACAAQQDHKRRAGDETGNNPAPVKAAAPNADATSIRVGVERVDQLINLVGELVITHAMLAQTTSRVDPVAHEGLLKGMSMLAHNTRALQEAVMSIRMMPISFVFSRFPRVVRDLAGKLNKEVELKTVGENTELDKGLVEKIADPLNHLVRNSIDHGIETPEKRLATSGRSRLIHPRSSSARAAHGPSLFQMLMVSSDKGTAMLPREFQCWPAPAGSAPKRLRPRGPTGGAGLRFFRPPRARGQGCAESQRQHGRANAARAGRPHDLCHSPPPSPPPSHRRPTADALPNSARYNPAALPIALPHCQRRPRDASS